VECLNGYGLKRLNGKRVEKFEWLKGARALRVGGLKFG
jgi:hypothetical protein